MSNTLKSLLAIGVALYTLPTLAGDLLSASDLKSDAYRAQQSTVPILVIFEEDDCPYCAVVKRDYLVPLMDVPDRRRRLLIRTINRDANTSVHGFDGHAMSHREFAQQQGISFVPTLRFFDHAGRQLVPDLVGLMTEDFYGHYLARAIDEAQAALSRRR